MNSKTIQKIIPIILAGGTGSRLWPLSRKSFPKQFLNLLDSEQTMLQKTYKRIENIDDIFRPIVICNEEHRFIVGHQMREINVEPLEIILELSCSAILSPRIFIDPPLSTELVSLEVMVPSTKTSPDD